MSPLSSAELLGLARQMDRAALAIEHRDATLCPVMLLRLLEQDLVLRAAEASVDEMAAARPTGRWLGRWVLRGRTA